MPLPAEARGWRAGWRIPAALVLLHAVLALLAFVPSPYAGGDNASYATLARSLLERGDYVELWDPSLRPHTQYPPVFPALLALLTAVGAGTWVAFKLLVLAFSAAAVALSYLWLRRVAAPGVALAAGVFLALSPGVLELSHWELSDVPFWAFTLLALWAFSHLPGHPGAAPPAAGAGEDPHGRRWLALAAVATLLAYFTRSAGLPLVVAAVGWLALRRRWGELARFAAVVGVPALLWGARNRLVGGGSGYLDSIWQAAPYRPELGTIGPLGLVPRALENAGVYLSDHLPRLMFGTPAVGVVAPAAVVALAAVGWARRVRRPGVPELFLPLYLGMVLVWPTSWAGDRFVLPVLPLLLFYAGETGRELLARTPRPVAVGVAAAIVLYALAVPGLVRQVRLGTRCTAAYLRGDRLACVDGQWRDFFAVGERAAGRLPAGSVVLSRKPTVFHALSGHRGRLYPFSARPEDLLAAMREAGAEYVVADHATRQSTRYLEPALLSGRLRLCRVPGLGLPRAVVVRVDTAVLLPPGPPPVRVEACAGNEVLSPES